MPEYDESQIHLIYMCNVYMATSGVPYAPPTENFPIFISRVFLPNTTVLTFDEAKKYFITFPVAQ